MTFGRGARVTAGDREIELARVRWGPPDATTSLEAPTWARGDGAASVAVDATGECVRRLEGRREGLVEWFENAPSGMEHGYTVAADPGGEGLVFEIAVEGAVEGAVEIAVEGAAEGAAADVEEDAAAVSPAASERCNGTDDDCDGDTDEDSAVDAPTWYPDLDADGYGGAASVVSCASPGGYLAVGGDCDDAVASSSPLGTETCDDADNDCDGAVDEDVAVPTWYADTYGDTDGDTYGDTYGGAASVVSCDAPVAVDSCAAPDGYVGDATDCDDDRPATHPDAAEIWYDGVDQACDGGSDFDQDGDGQDAASAGPDCDDTDAAAYDGAAEIWYDGVDEDCAGGNDYDQDGDGLVALAEGGDDCDDTDVAVGVCPGAEPDPDPEEEDPTACGCSGGAGAPGAALALGAALGLLVRRRRDAR